ncbi:membrane protein insertase YidC [Rhodovulum sp. 12E13]|uniref:membrane protein insertase YidC n=1 Tax=Rhodovulum sp. 12E13 TaxID=2203891 RepID=UPI000E137D77|nr:membrane protein insertase YidC [Rhodovulum sp. 12E13]RDC70926.1 membrane protein insertase YidC [Rhodovulum sp. 12E13]
MDDQNKNLILATALSFLVILVWFLLFPPEEPVPPAEQPVASEQAPTVDPATGAPIASVPGSAETGGGSEPAAPQPDAAASEVADAPRIEIDTPRLSGSISLLGGRIDDLDLTRYQETLADDSPDVTLLSPVGTDGAYYALYGWAPGGGLTAEDVPGTDTMWQVEQGNVLTPDTPVVLRWDSPSGLIFRRTITVDDAYLFEVTQSVENPTQEARRAAPYGIIARHGLPDDLANFFILHEGVVGWVNDELVEGGFKYDQVADFDVSPQLGVPGEVFGGVEQGWIGFTDKYWMTSLIPQQGVTSTLAVLYQPGPDIYQTRAIYPTLDLAPGATAEQTSRLFAGAKEWEVIRTYQNEEGIVNFLDSIDWGWFFFLTKPIFAVLHFLNIWIGNMGWSIIALTLLIKALLLPLAYKSYVSMAKMKELQPEMEKIKERAGDDRQKLQKEMMELYKKEKVNPASGCLPILLQIPIFFSLYKVIFVTIELRHAPWFGPFRDLSVPDPTSIFNLFGLFPWQAPPPESLLALIFIGILPIVLGVSMWLQQKLNPAPTDPTQQMIFAWMPWVFMFILGGFASGLLVYWIANNVLTFAQQYAIMRSQGYKPDLFGNIASSFRKSKPDAK